VAAEALLASRREATRALSEQLETGREGLDALIDSRDATAIGNAVLAQHDLGEQLRALNEQFLIDFSNLLTSTQQEQFSIIREMTRGDGLLGRGGPGLRMRGRGGRGPGGPGAPE
jgi:hypothetical protein